ncbi:hypothetical protein [Rubripirellula reticaptiva]|uniref:Uncharacterized protein n=1 Tax=Rubripirellula reticaptiva TaxID=2528013 RepID=A0A5C6ELR2_9BACT|nr:hypothetical protein [Rubripirellula reticaptiva]TWU49425.1 hypothetical protein Poly59_40400 [Rubripirellula reticaptiva]
MSSRAPNFSSTFAIVDDQLEETEKRLEQRRLEKDRAKLAEKTTATEAAKKLPVEKPTEKVAAIKAKPIKKKTASGQGTSAPRITKKEVRRNLNLKVLDETEQKFSRLFHTLQLAGDGRRKQDLADEAFGLLFEKYKSITS